MIYICYGIPKSASTFAFTIAYEVACEKTDQAGLWSTFPVEYSNEYLENLDVNIDRLLSIVPENEILVIKTHQRLTQKLHDWLRAGVCRAQVSIRDPYDIALSLFEAGESERKRPPSQQRRGFTEIHTIEDALGRTRRVLIDAVYWLEFQEKLQYPVIDFSQVCKHPYEVARRIADNMGVSADTDQIVTKYVSDKQTIDEFNKGVEGRGRERIKLNSKDPGKRLFDTFCDRYLGLPLG
jgi:hypothetical protein